MDRYKKYALGWPATLAIVLAMILASYLIASGIRDGADTALKGATRLNTSSNPKVQVSGDKVFYLDGGSLHCLSSKGSYLWSLGVDVNSEFIAGDYGVAIWNNRALTIVERDTGGSKVAKTMAENILSVRVGDSHIAAVLGPEHNSTVVLMDSYGEDVDTLTDFGGVTVLDSGFFIGRALYWIMTLDSSGSLPTCTIATYKPGRISTGTITDMHQVIYQVMFRSSRICAVGTSFMRVYDYNGREQSSECVTVYGWYLDSVDKENENPLMLFVPNAQVEGSPRINDVRMIRGASENIVHLPFTCFHLEAKGSTMYGFSEEYVSVCGFSQSAAKSYKLPVLVDNVIGVTSDKTAVVTSGGYLYLIKLP